MGKSSCIIGFMMMITWQIACEGSLTREIKTDYSDHKTKGVLFSILSNSDPRDTAFRNFGYSAGKDGSELTLNNRIYITNSATPGYSKTKFYGAQIALMSDRLKLPLKFHNRDEHLGLERPFYTVEESIIPGSIYQITGEFNSDEADSFIQYWPPFSAMDIMPEPIPFHLEEAKIEHTEITVSRAEGYVDIKIEDERGRRNVYQVEITVIQKGDEGTDQHPVVIYSSIINPDNRVNTEVFGSFSNDLFEESDFTREGRKRIYFDFKTEQMMSNDSTPSMLMVRITNLSENYIRFLRSSRQYYANQDNPFVEPVEIYTNVKNGYGIFALGARSYGEIKL